MNIVDTTKKIKTILDKIFKAFTLLSEKLDFLANDDLFLVNNDSFIRIILWLVHINKESIT